MAAIFYTEDVTKLLRNSFVVIIGDSNQRGVYKDLILLLQSNRYLTDQELKSKGENSCLNDVQLEQSTMSNGTDYREVREYKTDYHWIRFYFVTRVNSPYMKTIFTSLMDLIPDILIMNSCLWDISRYGPHSMAAYKKNLKKTFQMLRVSFWDRCRIIWNTALPVASKVKGGFLLPELSSLCDSLNLNVMEGNYYACQLAKFHDFDIVDLNYMFKDLLHWRAGDGIHWQMRAHRRITNIILTHICSTWGVQTPRHNFDTFQAVSAHVNMRLARPNQEVNSEPRPKVAKLCNFTELDNLPQYLDFDSEPKPIHPIITPRVNKKDQSQSFAAPISHVVSASNPPKVNAQRIPPLMQMRNQQNSVGTPHIQPEPCQRVFHQQNLHAMQQFWKMYVAQSYGYNHYNEEYAPHMFCQYPDLRAPRHAPYVHRNIMHSRRMEYSRRQQERIAMERRRAFRHLMY
ncbi:PC-esterase domain-containing protein 1A-like [Anneissia japonica]|uniref:PC-esterase domain-containing protein 1A-like n=1 Tax=Anneissia japonica TaxID=1529436 RepID=UPI00142569AB|nr:PC-esterase domain-containing protein 1A-like [Anneissia japonica]XP_033098872.1 PC-esterase domain-containing protein 1A-like [Anneissia japonica]